MFPHSRAEFILTWGSIVFIAGSSAVDNLSHQSSVHTTFQDFCSNRRGIKRATLDDIMYAGNLGAKNSYGCNLMLVDDSIAERYRYTINMTNSAPVSQSCVCWLKIGPDGGVNGFQHGNQVLNFTLPLAGHRVLAADENTIGGCTCSQGVIPLNSNKQFGSTWLEFALGVQGPEGANGGWSAADASCIVSAAAGLNIPGLQVCSQGVCSTIHPGGTGDNAYLKGMEDLNGIGINQPPGEVRMTANFGYSG